MPELIGFIAQRKPMIGRHDVAVLVDGRKNHEVGTSALRGDVGHLQRTEAAREGKLRVVGDILVAKDQNRMLLERRAGLPVRLIIGSDISKRYTTELGGKARTYRDDFHRRSLCLMLVSLKISGPARSAAGREKPLLQYGALP